MGRVRSTIYNQLTAPAVRRFAMLIVNCLFSLTLLTVTSTHRAPAQTGLHGALEMTWQQGPDVLDRRGVAGPFVGVVESKLIVAGGANFPNALPWNGGQKVWYDRVWFLDDNSDWSEIGKLPTTLGYGVSITTSAGLICIGGSNADAHVADVVRLSIEAGAVRTEKLPALPHPIANACGVLIEDTVYVAGGLLDAQSKQALKTFYAFDLSAQESQWKELPTWPGPPRMLAVAAELEQQFYLISGVDLTDNVSVNAQRRYLNDAYRFHPRSGWEQIADLPSAVAAAPSPAIVNGSQLLIIGGDDGRHVGFQPPDQHPGFSNRILVYDVRTNKWSEAGEAPVATVTTSCVPWAGAWWFPTGEIRPGVRSPELWQLRLAPKL